MRICFYTETALPTLGGQQVVVDRLARELVALGHDVTVLAPRASGASLPYRLVTHPRFVSTTHFVRHYARYLTRLPRFDVLHCHSLYPTGWIAASAKRQLRVPLVITSHGGDVRPGGLRDRKPHLRPRYDQALAAADALVAISPFTRAALSAASEKIVDIPNGVDVDRYATPSPRPRADPYVLFLGRLTRPKGVDLAAAAALHFPPGVRLVVAGQGPERVEGGHVTLLGRQDDAAKVALLQHALCTLVPSRNYEAFGLVALESMAAGRPVVASDLPGLSHLVRGHGLLVPPDSPAPIADAVRQLHADPALADSLGRAGRQTAAAYDWPLIARRHADLYSRLISRPS